MNQEIPWKRLAVEAVVIVGSILLAFAIDAWWQNRINQAAEIELLEGMAQDLADNQERLRVQVRDLESAISELGYFVTATDLRLAYAGSTLDLGEIVQHMYRTYTTMGVMRGFLESTTNSGMLAQISSPDIRSALARIESASTVIESVSGDIRTLTDLSIVELGRYPESLRPTWDDQFSYSQVGVELASQLHSDAELMALSNAKLSRFRTLASNYRGMVGGMQSLINLINEEISNM